MPTLAAPLDCAKLEIRNEQVHQLAAAPSTPVKGQLYYNTGDNTLYYWNNTIWVAASAAAGGPPTGTAGGDLAGTYPNPDIKALTIVLADCNASMADQAAGTASLRTLALSGSAAMPGIARLDQISGAGALGRPTADLDFNSRKITALAAPVSGTDAANKAYVDSVAQGLDVKASCRTASVTLTNIVVASPGANIDGVAMAAGDRVLLKEQTTNTENGIYVWNGAAVPMTRSTDADTGGVGGDVSAGMYTFVTEGTTNADTGWILTTNDPITLGSTGLVFTQFSGAGMVNAGNGLTKTGNTLDVVGTSQRITVLADSIDIDSGYIGQASITTVSSTTGITTGLWKAGIHGIPYGGTNAASATGARLSLGVPTWYTTATHAAGTTITIPQTTHHIYSGGAAGRGILMQASIEATGAQILPDTSINASGDVTFTFSASQSANTIRVILIGLQTGGAPDQPI